MTAEEARRWELLEEIEPWGKRAEDLRTLYLAAIIKAVNSDSDHVGAFQREASKILDQLIGPPAGPSQRDMAEGLRRAAAGRRQ